MGGGGGCKKASNISISFTTTSRNFLVASNVSFTKTEQKKLFPQVEYKMKPEQANRKRLLSIEHNLRSNIIFDEVRPSLFCPIWHHIFDGFDFRGETGGILS